MNDMDNKEFGAFIDVIERQYPRQQPLNDVQKGMFWLSLQKFSLDDCMAAFVLHCESKDGEWKPQVCHITKSLKNTEVSIRSTFNDFFKHKEVKDERAIKIYKQMGGREMHKLPEYVTNKKEDLFVELYMAEESQETFAELPNKLKTKLIGVKK